MALLFLPMLSLLGASAVYGEDAIPGAVWGVGFAAAFGGSWLWWSVALPRWRVWAIESTTDLSELLVQAVASQLMWPPGHFFEKTEVRPRALRLRLQHSLRRSLAHYAEASPEDAAALRVVVEPWLYPGRQPRRSRRQGASGGGYLLLLVGALLLVIPSTRVIANVVYGTSVSWPGVAWITAACLLMIVVGYSRSSTDVRIPLYFFFIFLGLALCSMVLRSYPLRPVEVVLLIVGVVSGGSSYLSLKAMGGRSG